MEGNEDKKWRLVVLETQIDHILRSEQHGFSGWLTISVSEVDVLESKVFSDIVVVGNVDANGNAWRSKGQNIQTGEIWFFELIDFKLFSPSQVLQSDRSAIDQFVQQLRFLLVDYGDESLKLCSDLQGVQIAFDKSNVGLNDGPNVLDPMFLRLLVFFHIACPEVVDVLANHVSLNLVGRVYLWFSQVFVDKFQEGREFSVPDCQFKTVFLDNFLFGLDWGNFKNELVFTYLHKSVIFWHQSSFYCNFFNFFSISRCNVARVIPCGTLLVAKIQKAIRFVVSKNKLFYPVINLAEFLLVAGPVWTEQKELSQWILWTFRYKFWVAKWLEISTVVQKCW
jgi:hypothetical protein